MSLLIVRFRSLNRHDNGTGITLSLLSIIYIKNKLIKCTYRVNNGLCMYLCNPTILFKIFNICPYPVNMENNKQGPDFDDLKIL